MRLVRQLKAEGLIKSVYRRAAGAGTFIILEGESTSATSGSRSKQRLTSTTPRLRTASRSSPSPNDPGKNGATSPAAAGDDRLLRHGSTRLHRSAERRV